ncbi:MAG: hypothetical protein KDD25_04545 [Bdellovibrionales bacterium]|nr:hypothetical protein [Bdellovibrionales bacterium]
MAKVKSSNWIPLADYSTKYKISISTLRRRIRCNNIDFRMDNGKYFLSDEPLSKNSRGRKPLEESNYSFVEDSEKSTPNSLNPIEIVAKAETPSPPSIESTNTAIAEPLASPSAGVFTAASALLEEIKKAYSLILHEKEEMILQLKEEISDLRTLARVLESENERLKKL